MNVSEQHLWNTVEALWEITMAQDLIRLEKSLHHHFSGWVTGHDKIIDFAEAIASAGFGTSKILHYDLTPLKISVFEEQTGVVHYRYRAEIENKKGKTDLIQGRWTEVYTYKDKQWIFVAVSGGPDGQR